MNSYRGSPKQKPGELTEQRPIKLILASQDVLRLEMAVRAWSAEAGFTVKATVTTPEEFLQLYRKGGFDVAIVAVNLWWEVFPRYHAEAHSLPDRQRIPIVVSGDHPEQEGQRVLSTTADAYVGAPDHFSDVVEVVRCVARGFKVFPREIAASTPLPLDAAWSRFQQAFGPRLSNRELEVAKLVATGKFDGEIADHLGLSIRTVQGVVYRVLDKLGLESRLQLAVLVWSGNLDFFSRRPAPVGPPAA